MLLRYINLSFFNLRKCFFLSNCCTKYCPTVIKHCSRCRLKARCYVVKCVPKGNRAVDHFFGLLNNLILLSDFLFFSSLNSLVCLLCFFILFADKLLSVLKFFSIATIVLYRCCIGLLLSKRHLPYVGFVLLKECTVSCVG